MNERRVLSPLALLTCALSLSPPPVLPPGVRIGEGGRGREKRARLHHLSRKQEEEAQKKRERDGGRYQYHVLRVLIWMRTCVLQGPSTPEPSIYINAFALPRTKNQDGCNDKSTTLQPSNRTRNTRCSPASPSCLRPGLASSSGRRPTSEYRATPSPSSSSCSLPPPQRPRL